MGDIVPQGEIQFLGNVLAHCTVMGHSMVRCAKSAEPINMPFRIKTPVCPWNHVLYGCADAPTEVIIFGVVRHSNASAIFAALAAATSLQEGSSITNNVMHHKGSFSMPNLDTPTAMNSQRLLQLNSVIMMCDCRCKKVIVSSFGASNTLSQLDSISHTTGAHLDVERHDDKLHVIIR